MSPDSASPEALSLHSSAVPLDPSVACRSRFYYGWIMVPVAAAAMVATFPGRTFGLGIITERLLNDPTLKLTRTSFGQINLWATLVGALFCLGVGRLIDRYGVRLALARRARGLGAQRSGDELRRGVLLFFCAVTLTRGFGQSAFRWSVSRSSESGSSGD